MPDSFVQRLQVAIADRYRLERELGAGGMATVWLARDLRHDREVAIKLLRPELTAVLGVDRFLAEIRLTARLDHPHILTLIDSGEADGLLYYVLPYVRGESLRARLDREKQVPIDEAVRLVRQVASALAFAHGRGVVHRDIKPENILLHEGEAVVTDFGIALALREAGGTRLTESGLSLGTPQYMSPEQATGDRELDARSDVYSLGAVLYELLTGDPPHSGATVQGVIAKLLTEKPTPPRTLRDTIPEALEDAVLTALAKVPADRFRGAAAFDEAIARALTLPARSSTAVVRTTSRQRWRQRVAYAAGLLLAAAGGAWVARQGASTPSREAPAEGLQVTFSGDVIDFALAPDAQRLALGRLACADAARCQTLVEVRDVRGGTGLPLARFLATYDMKWSRDGRFLLITAADSTGRYGLFRVSTLGGPVSYLGLYGFAQSIGRSDSLLVAFSDLRGHRIGVLVPGQAALLDDTLFPGVRQFAIAPDGQHVITYDRSAGRPRLRLFDRAWRALDSLEVPRFYDHPLWSSSGDAVMWIASAGGLRIEEVSVDVRAGRFRGAPVPRTAAFEMPQSFSGRRLDMADDGSLAYLTGLTPRIMHLMTRPRGGEVLRVARRLEGQTGRLRAFIAPDGSDIVFSRLVADGDSLFDQLVSLNTSTGVEREVSPPLTNFVDATWTADGGALIYAWHEEGVGTRIVRWERANGRRRDAGLYPGRAMNLMWTLPDESLLTLGVNGATIERLASGTAERTRSYAMPDSQSVQVVAPSPDGRRASTLGWTANGDSLVVGLLDTESGKWAEHARLYAEGPGSMRWLGNGTVEFTLASSVSTSDLYRYDPDRGTVQRIGELPVPFATYNLSSNGRWATAVERQVVSNVQLIRPGRR